MGSGTPLFSLAPNERIETVWDRIMKEQSYSNLHKGMAFMQNGQYSRASLEFSKALDKNPSSMAHAMHGASLYWMGDVPASLEQYAKALELDPENSMAWQLKGISEAKSGDPEKALEDFEKALKLDPSRPDVNMNMGSIYFSKGHMASAIAHIKNAVKLDGRNPLYHYQLGLVYFYLERYDEAEESFKKAVAFYPAYEEALLWLGITAERKGELKQAVRVYKKAVDLKPHDFFARYKLSLASLRAGDVKNLPKYIKKSFLLTPKNQLGGISLFISYSAGKEKPSGSGGKKGEKFSDHNLSEIYKNLMRVPEDEEITFSVDLVSAEKFGLEKAGEGRMKNALSANFRPLSRKYVSKDYFLPAGGKEEREAAVSRALGELEKEIASGSDKMDSRVNFSMNTRKSRDYSPAPDDSRVVYSPRNVGNDMGLWIIGNNWLSIVEDDLENPEAAGAAGPYALVYGLANLLLGESEGALAYFERSSGEYPALSKMGAAVSHVCLGDEAKAGEILR
ncbi:MAG: hypothetical protein COT17_08510, partial [Elusimicrobia bacterium CG08_land_8_20_14_0_20_51_18]